MNERPKHFIREWRKYRGLTQEQLAGRIDMTPSTVSQLETGKQGYSQGTLEALAYALQCEPGDLLVRDPTRPDAIWSIWETLSPAEREQGIRLLTALKGGDRTGTDG